MKVKKQHLIVYILVIIMIAFVSMYRLPYYVYQPGGADSLDDILTVENGYQSEGDMHLVTVRGGQATLVQLLWAKFASYHEIMPLEQVRPQNMSEEEHRQQQLQMMENSQDSSVVVAYEAAGKEIEMAYNGVYIVSVEADMPAEGLLEIGDRIYKVDDYDIEKADDLQDAIKRKEAGDKVDIYLERDEESLSKTITLESLDALEGQAGMGISLVTDQSVKKVDPPVNFSSGSIGGPSAGLMFALKIYDQLVEEDLTKGYEVIGTGGLNYDGSVYRIGGIDKKVVAADKAGCDIFFAPYEDGGEYSNYAVAKKTAEDINTDMDIIPINSFEEALNYLEELEWKD